MPKEFFIEQPTQKEIESKLKELKKYPELKLRLTVAWPITEEKKQLLEMASDEEITEKKDIEKVLNIVQSPDIIERKTGLYLLKKIKPSAEDAISILPELKSLIKKYEDSDDSEGMKAHILAIEAMGNFGKVGLDNLREMTKEIACSYGWKESEALVKGFYRAGEKALPDLKALLNRYGDDDAFSIKTSIAQNLYLLGEKALPALEELRLNPIIYYEAAAEFINKIKEKREAKKTYPKWLATRKPLFATPYIPELAEKLSLIDKAVKILGDKYKDKFIGLIVFGSSYKGYWKSGSDIDYMLSGLEKNQEIHEQFKKLTENIYFCPSLSNYLYQKPTKTGDIARMFFGIFFGNRKKLLEIQKQVLKDMNETHWNEVRNFILSSEIDLEKAQDRFQINDEKLIEQIKANIALLRVPPPLEEARKIISQKYKQEQEMEKNKKE